jgi:hypothetical protein
LAGFLLELTDDLYLTVYETASSEKEKRPSVLILKEPENRQNLTDVAVMDPREGLLFEWKIEGGKEVDSGNAMVWRSLLVDGRPQVSGFAIHCVLPHLTNTPYPPWGQM